ncbi:MAG: phosphatase PAP2 family protein [Melioribacteraceae bacterium]
MKTILKNLSIIDWVNIIFLACLTFFLIAVFNKTPYPIETLLLYCGLFVFIIMFAIFRGSHLSPKWKRLILFINPVIFLIISFESLYMLVQYFNKNRYDALLDKIDIAILSVSPTIYIEQFTHPLFTDIFYLFYLIYFPMPIIILGVMFKRNMFVEVEKSLLIYLFTYYLAYILYFFVPAEGPRFFLLNEYAYPLTGIFLAEPIRQIVNTFEPNTLDVFPSLHTAILAVTMFVSYKYNRKVFNWFILPAIGIPISLIYCRYHYFVDMIAGLVLAVFSFWLASKIYDKISSRFVNHFGEL